MMQPENSDDTAMGRAAQRVKETVHYVTRGTGYLASAAKQAVTGTNVSAESQQPAGRTVLRYTGLRPNSLLAWRYDM